MGQIDVGTLSPFSFASTLSNFAVAAVLALTIQLVYRHFGRSSSNRDRTAYIFPLITLTTFLIIVVVKSSIALSLGLVGALSIVRFRTPIKDPETLGYFFLSIGTGLGLGAERTLITVVLVLGILSWYFFAGVWKRRDQYSNLFLTVQSNQESSDETVTELTQILGKYTRQVDLRRFDCANKQFQATYLLDLGAHTDLQNILKKVREKFPEAELSFLDNNAMPVG